MRGQRGWSLLELLVVCAMVALIAFIAVDGAMKADAKFKLENLLGAHFDGVVPGQITDYQRLVLQPLVTRRLNDLCAEVSAGARGAPESDPEEVRRLLNLLKSAEERQRDCARARATAQKNGFTLP